MLSALHSPVRKPLTDASTSRRKGSKKSCLEGEKIMLRQDQVTERQSRLGSRRQASALRATCPLCRVLWPIVVQHRHLVFDDVLSKKPTVRIKTLSEHNVRSNPFDLDVPQTCLTSQCEVDQRRQEPIPNER